MGTKKAVLTMLLAFSSYAVWAQKGDPILGLWANANGQDHILIYKHGDHFFGKLDWIKFSNDENGKLKTDKNNPDPALRSRPDLGLELLKDFTSDGDNVYSGGTIYDPNNGKTYNCKMKLEGNTLTIRGYIGISLFGRSVTWTRIK